MTKSRNPSLVGFLILAVVVVALVLTRAPFWTWLVCCFAALVAAIIVGRGLSQQICLSAASVVAALCVLEFIGSFSEPSVAFDIDKGLVEPRLVVGFGPDHAGVYRARKYVSGRLEYDVRYTVDQRLFRKVDAGTDGVATAFFGDSFIFGIGVNDAGTLPQIFSNLERRKLPVFNLGIGAYSPAQVLATMQAGLVDDLIARSELLVQFVAPWHAERVACRREWVFDAPKYDLIKDKLRYDGFCRRPKRSPFEVSAFYRAFIEPRITVVDDHDMSVLVAVTKETVRLARDKYKKPMIVYYLRSPGILKHMRWTDDSIIAALRSAGADVLEYNIPGEDEPKYHVRGDPHPNGLANEVHAQRLADYIRRRYGFLSVAHALDDHVAPSRP